MTKPLLALFVVAAVLGGVAWLIVSLDGLPSNGAPVQQDVAAIPHSTVEGPPELQPLESANSGTIRNAGEEALPAQRGRDVSREIARTFAPAEDDAIEPDFEAKHGGKSLGALRHASAEAQRSLTPLWDREMDAYIARGLAEFTPQSRDGVLSSSTEGNDDPDVCVGGKSGDGGMYTVVLRREFSPDLFTILDEIAWLKAEIKKAEQ